jgi:hypothetical protein
MPKIKFIASDEETYGRVSKPEPAVKYVPDWYKKANKFRYSNTPEFNDDSYPQGTVKSCIPVLDSIAAGYIQTTWTDIYIEEAAFGNVKYRWASGPTIMGSRDDWQKQNLATPAGHRSQMFTWSRPWAIHTPKNYSCMFVHPMYHNDLPFTSFPGIIDTDNYVMPGQSSVPFFIKEGFTGLIPAGTPMYQIIPFKVETWTSDKEFTESMHLIEKTKYMIESKFYDGYKKLFWNKKKYH